MYVNVITRNTFRLVEFDRSQTEWPPYADTIVSTIRKIIRSLNSKGFKNVTKNYSVIFHFKLKFSGVGESKNIQKTRKFLVHPEKL